MFSIYLQAGEEETESLLPEHQKALDELKNKFSIERLLDGKENSINKENEDEEEASSPPKIVPKAKVIKRDKSEPKKGKPESPERSKNNKVKTNIKLRNASLDESKQPKTKTPQAIHFEPLQKGSELHHPTKGKTEDIEDAPKIYKKGKGNERIKRLAYSIEMYQKDFFALQEAALATSNSYLDQENSDTRRAELQDKRLTTQFLMKHKPEYIKQVEKLELIVELLKQTEPELQRLSKKPESKRLKTEVKIELSDLLATMNRYKGDMQVFIDYILEYEKNKNEAEKNKYESYQKQLEEGKNNLEQQEGKMRKRYNEIKSQLSGYDHGFWARMFGPETGTYVKYLFKDVINIKNSAVRTLFDFMESETDMDAIVEQVIEKGMKTYEAEVTEEVAKNRMKEQYKAQGNDQAKQAMKQEMTNKVKLAFQNLLTGNVSSIIKHQNDAMNEVDNYEQMRQTLSTQLVEIHELEQQRIKLNTRIDAVNREMDTWKLQQSTWMTAYPKIFLILLQEVQKTLNIVQAETFDKNVYQHQLEIIRDEWEDVRTSLAKYKLAMEHHL